MFSAQRVYIYWYFIACTVNLSVNLIEQIPERYVNTHSNFTFCLAQRLQELISEYFIMK